MSSRPNEPAESLNQQFADLHAHRVATMDPALLKINIDQRRTLVDTADRSKFVKAGDRVAPFVLEEVEGERLTLASLTERGPAVLIFFRFAGCPACNLALPHYDRQLSPALRELGVPLVAVSPQVPARLVEIKRRHQLVLSVATDWDNHLGRALGILYEFDEASKASAVAKGSPIGDVTGTGTWELPMPTVVVIGPDRVVRFADVSPDWLVRTEASFILDAVRAARQSAAAA